MTKKIITVLFLLIPFFVNAQRCIIDMDKNLAYDAEVKLKQIGNQQYAEVYMLEIPKSKTARPKSVLAYIEPSYIGTLNSMPRPVYVDYVSVIYFKGRFMEANANEKKDAIKLITHFGNIEPTPYFPPLLGEKSGERSIGYFDLTHTVFYPVIFKKPGKDTVIWQTSMTTVDTSRNGSLDFEQTMITLQNHDQVDFLDSLANVARVETVKSVWSNSSDRFLLVSESPYTLTDDLVEKTTFNPPFKMDGKIYLLSRRGWTDKYSQNIVWGIDTVEKKQIVEEFVDASMSNIIKVRAENLGQNTVKISWEDPHGTSDTADYIIRVKYPSGNEKQFIAKNCCTLKLSKLPSGTYGGIFFVTVYSPKGEEGVVEFEN